MVEEYKEDLSEFAAKWRLHDESQQLLYSLPEEVQQKILLSFSPRDAERDANAIFMKFARSVSQTCQGAEEMQEFITRWGLNEESCQMLQRIDSSVREKVMREFAPRDTSSDANNIFMRFAQGVAAKGGKGGFKGASAKGKGGFVQPHQQFQHFGHSQMQYVPAAITPHYQAPMQAAGAAYANSGGELHDPVLVQFAARWNLRAEAKAILASLSPHAQQKVAQEFSPRDTSRDCNAIFIKFASGHALPSAYPQQHAAYPQQQHHQQQGHAYPPQAFPPHDAHKVTSGKSGQAFDDPVLSQFVARWSLRSEAQDLLASLQPAAQQKIMQEFSPRDTSRDCNSIFMKFASSHSGQPRQQQAFQQQQRHQSPAPPRLGESLPYHADPGQEMVAQEFLEQWRLGPEAQQTFYGLLPEQQEKVMQEFSPRDASSDANNIFIRFCTGVARGTSSGRGKGGAPGFAPY